MHAAAVERVRSFNRVVAERIGALDEGYLGRGRPLGEARLLWAIEPRGTEVRALRRSLGLDSGYVSRLLRALEAQGLVIVGTSEADRRARVARLTASGRRERAAYDRLSERLAGSILEALDEAQRARLADAMATVERLLTASMVAVAPEDPATADARHCLGSYFADLGRRFDGGFDPAQSIPAEDDDLRPPAGLLLVARLRGAPVGCGALKHRPRGVSEVKRMWVAPETRGMGLGRRMLRELEGHAAAAGTRLLRLETNRTLTEAISLYRSEGYREVPAFNDEAYAHHWFEKMVRQPDAP